MSDDSLPTIKYLQECFRYENGKLFWLARPRDHFNSDFGMNVFNTMYADKEAGCVSKTRNNYRCVVVIGPKRFLRSRIIWAIHNGRWPTDLIDHVNRISTDDRIDNLREATARQNGFNHNRNRNNKSGFKGVSWYKPRRKWKATINVNDKRKHLGYFYTPEEAHEAYCYAAKQYYGEFACTGSSLIGEGGEEAK